MKNFDQRVSLAISAAVKASEKIMNIYNGLGYEIRQKVDLTPVTEADLASDEIIRDVLSKTDIPVISEEGAVSMAVEDLYWLVDPLDGTKEFIRKNGEFCINIALIQNYIPTVGIIAIPAKNELFVSTGFMNVYKAETVSWSGENLHFQQLAPTIVHSKKKELNLLMSRSHCKSAADDSVLSKLEKRFVLKNIKIGSAIKYTYLLEGRGDIYYRIGHTMEWDTAAGDAMLRAFGGGVYDIRTGKLLQYGKEGLINTDFIASLMPVDYLI